MDHIGIVGCSAPGAALCFQTICVESGQTLNEKHAHPEVSMHTPSFASYMACLHKEPTDWVGVADLMLASAHKLKALGCSFAICPDNTIHAAFIHTRLADSFPLPFLHIADAVAEEAIQRSFKRVGITGTMWLTQSDVYPRAFAERGIEFVRPQQTEMEAIQRVIFEELTQGIVSAEGEKTFVDIIRRLQEEEKCDAVVLGCTEIPLIISDHNSPIPTLDSTRLLARAAIKRACGGQDAESILETGCV